MKISVHYIAEVFNLIGFIVCLVYFLKKPIKDFVQKRHIEFSEEFKSASNSLLLAKTRFELETKRYIRANDEAFGIERTMKHHADIVAKRIIKNANDEAERIIEASNIYSENLRKEMLNKAKEEELIKISLKVREKCKNNLQDLDLSEKILKSSIEKASKTFDSIKSCSVEHGGQLNE